MLNLHWDHIDEEVIHLCQGKTNQRLRVSLSQDISRMLKNWPTQSGYLFPTRSGSKYTSMGFGSIWRRAMNKYVSSGGERFHEHDLRGKVATDHAQRSTTDSYIKQRHIDVVQPARRKKK